MVTGQLGPQGRAERLEYCRINIDAIFPMIKILIAPISYDGDTIDHNVIRVFTVVRKEERYIAVYEYWQSGILMETALDHIRLTCKAIIDSYIITEDDFTKEEIYKK